MSDHLHPTPTRLALLADIDAGRVFRDAAGHDYISGGRKVSAQALEMRDAAWCALPDGPGRPWTLTAYGRAIRAVRVLDRDDGDHIVAETGDPDEPRHLGDAKPIKPGRQWLITVGQHAAARDRVHEAREELRHLAATALAADPAFTVQEGHG